MPIEDRAAAGYTAPGSVPITFSAVSRSNVPTDPLHLLSNGRESLAISLEAALLQKLTLDVVSRICLSWETESRMDAPLRESLFPALVDVAGFQSAGEEQSLVQRREQERLEARLRAAFEADPLEDGMYHPAEEIIGEALQSTDGQRVLERLKAFSLDAAHPSFPASVLRCLGRQERPGTGEWRTGLVHDGLASTHVEIRDAAVQAAELWGNRGMAGYPPDACRACVVASRLHPGRH